MRASDIARALIKQFEGLRSHAYQDQVGVWTIGYGHTGPDVKPGMMISQAQAENLLSGDITKVDQAIARQVKVPLTQNQYDALASFVFNLGEGNLHHSHLLTYLNHGHYDLAGHEFLRWNHAGGQICPGLTRRREAEKELWEKPV